MAKSQPDFVIDCPLAPSVNRLYRSGRGRVYKSDIYQQWLRELWVAWLRVKPAGFKTIMTPVRWQVEVNAPRRDLDNNLKALQDGLQDLRIIGNDRQLRDTHILENKAIEACRIKLWL